MYAEAIKKFQKSLELSYSEWALGLLGYAYGKVGMKDEALKLVEEIHKKSRIKDVSNFTKSLIYSGIGKKNEALNYLEMAYEEREGLLMALKIDPLLDDLRSDPRFKALIKKTNLELCSSEIPRPLEERCSRYS